MELKRKRGHGSVMNNLASTLKMTLPWSKNKESLTDRGEERRSKSKSLKGEKKKRRLSVSTYESLDQQKQKLS